MPTEQQNPENQTDFGSYRMLLKVSLGARYCRSRGFKIESTRCLKLHDQQQYLCVGQTLCKGCLLQNVQFERKNRHCCGGLPRVESDVTGSGGKIIKLGKMAESNTRNTNE